MSSATIISPETAENRVVDSASVSKSTRELLVESRKDAAQARIEARENQLASHIDAGERLALHLANAANAVSIDKAKNILAETDAVIDASFDGRSRQNQRNEIKKQICLAALAGIVNFTDLPVGHAFCFVGTIVKYNLQTGQGEVNLDAVQPCRQVIADYRACKMDVKSFREALRVALGLPIKSKKTETAVLELFRAILADETTSEERRRLILATHPELDPQHVDSASVVVALNALGKLTAASQLAAVTQFLTTHPELGESIALSLMGDNPATN